MIREPIIFVLLFTAALLMLFVSALSFRKRHLAVARYNALSMLAASFYALGYAFEATSLNLGSILFWLKVEYLGIPFISSLWLLFVIHYTGYQKLLKRWVYGLLFLVPLLTFVLHLTNASHQLFYTDVSLGEEGMSLLHLTRGPWYWVHISYTYLQAAAGLGLFIAAYIKATPIVRKQIVLLVMGALAPWVCNLIYVVWKDLDLIDLTPFGFVLTGMVQIWGIYRFHLLKLAPLALQSVYDTMQDGVIILDNENNITQVNHAAKHMISELRNFKENAASVLHVFHNKPELAAIILEGNQEAKILIEEEGERRHCSLRISALHDRNGERLGRMVILSDITKMTVYQEKLLASANEMAEMSAFKDKLFTLVAHDLRDPLAVLVNLTEVMESERQGTGGEEHDILREIGGHVRQTYLMMENLLEWYRSQSGKTAYRPSIWSLTASIEETIRSMGFRADMKGVQLSSELVDDHLIYADRDMLELVLRNLISNAIKFTPAGGDIQVGAMRQGDLYAIYVRDSGIGVDSDVAPSLFQDIQIGAKAGTDGEAGSGLGLYLCAKLVDIQGGEIWCESSGGKGSTFYFTVRAGGEGDSDEHMTSSTGARSNFVR